MALEKTSSANFPVRNGIHNMKAMYLEELAADKVHKFLFMLSPLKIQGGTTNARPACGCVLTGDYESH